MSELRLSSRVLGHQRRLKLPMGWELKIQNLANLLASSYKAITDLMINNHTRNEREILAFQSVSQNKIQNPATADYIFSQSNQHQPSPSPSGSGSQSPSNSGMGPSRDPKKPFRGLFRRIATGFKSALSLARKVLVIIGRPAYYVGVTMLVVAGKVVEFLSNTLKSGTKWAINIVSHIARNLAGLLINGFQGMRQWTASQGRRFLAWVKRMWQVAAPRIKDFLKRVFIKAWGFIKAIPRTFFRFTLRAIRGIFSFSWRLIIGAGRFLRNGAVNTYNNLRTRITAFAMNLRNAFSGAAAPIIGETISFAGRIFLYPTVMFLSPFAIKVLASLNNGSAATFGVNEFTNVGTYLFFGITLGLATAGVTMSRWFRRMRETLFPDISYDYLGIRGSALNRVSNTLLLGLSAFVYSVGSYGASIVPSFWQSLLAVTSGADIPISNVLPPPFTVQQLFSGLLDWKLWLPIGLIIFGRWISRIQPGAQIPAQPAGGQGVVNQNNAPQNNNQPNNPQQPPANQGP
ncbi:MAG: hypothetical protein N2654_04190 [Deltaproteobacteria bacterium]|nr:hypothetical protein [Deltaproteobacteria bacterium]